MKFTINIDYTFTSDGAWISSTVFINTYSCSTWKTFGSVSVTARPRCVRIVAFRFCQKCQNESFKIFSYNKRFTITINGQIVKNKYLIYARITFTSAASSYTTASFLTSKTRQVYWPASWGWISVIVSICEIFSCNISYRFDKVLKEKMFVRKWICIKRSSAYRRSRINLLVWISRKSSRSNPF